VPFLIWSIAYNAWWRPNGYTRQLAEAGHYSEAESADLLMRANRAYVHNCRIPATCVNEVPHIPQKRRHVGSVDRD